MTEILDVQKACLWTVLAASLVIVGCQAPPEKVNEPSPVVNPASSESAQSSGAVAVPSHAPIELEIQGKEIATFAGGCFWCVEKPFEVIDGVVAVHSGYTGGEEQNPTYKQVASGATGHTEAIRVIYDAEKVSYELLLNVFWRNIDPTQVAGQFVDHGAQYRTGIYYHTEQQQALAEASMKSVRAKFDAPIATELLSAGTFWAAEEYHQDFYKKNPDHYERYRKGSGRDAFLDKTWGAEAGGYSLHQTQ